MQSQSRVNTNLNTIIENLKSNNLEYTELPFSISPMILSGLTGGIPPGFEIPSDNEEEEDKKEEKSEIDSYHTEEISALEQLARALQHNTTIETILINSSSAFEENNNQLSLELTEAGAIAFSKAIKDHPKLKNFSMIFPGYPARRIAEEQLSTLFNAFTGCAPIEEIVIHVDFKNVDFIDTLAKKLNHKTQLKSFTLMASPGLNNMKNPHEKKEMTSESLAFTHLGAALGKQTHLRYLTLENISIKESDAIALATGLSNINSLIYLCLTRCKMNGKIFSHLTPILESNSKLITLILDANPLGQKGMLALAKALPNLKNLNRLSLKVTHQDDETLHLLATTLRQYNLPISDLNLSLNNIGNNTKAVEAIKEMIDENPYLKILTISHCNMLQNKVIKNMQDLLRDPKKCRLTHLIMDKSSDSQSLNRFFLQMLRENSNITFFRPVLTLSESEFNEIIYSNKMKKYQEKKQNYVEIAIALGQGMYAKTSPGQKKSGFSALDKNVAITILLFLGVETSWDQPHNTLLCTLLIFQNLTKRDTLIKKEEEKYDSKSGDISHWWYKKWIQKDKDDKVIEEKIIFQSSLFPKVKKAEDKNNSLVIEKNKCLIM